MPILSPNMLKTFEECPEKYRLKYIEKIETIQNSEFFEKGKKIHALANYYLQGFDIEKLEKALSPSERIDWKTLKENKYLKMAVFNTEYNLSCKIKDFWIGGRLDALVYYQNDYYILDYKTGKVPKNAQEDFQTMVYLLCADKLLKKKGGYDSLKFVYLGLKENEEKIIEFNEESKVHFEKKIFETCSKINSHNFVKNKSKCEFCEYKNLCN